MREARTETRRLRSSLISLLVLIPWMASGAERGSAAATEGASVRGRLHGTVILGPDVNTHRASFSLYPDVSVAGLAAASPSPTDELRNVVIYFESAPQAAAEHPGPSAPLKMEQVRESFVPHVLPVVMGSTVDFPNGDVIYHNVFSLSKAASFDLGRYPRGSFKSVKFDRPGAVKVFCHIHSDMSAVVLVLENPFFAVPDAKGNFAINDIPPGRYTVTAWHERARPVHRHVDIAAGGEAEVNFAIPLQDDPVDE